METLKIPEDKDVNWDYDEGADVLYISFGAPKAALGLDIGGGIVIMYRETEGDMVGITIIGVAEMLKPAKVDSVATVNRVAEQTSKYDSTLGR